MRWLLGSFSAFAILGVAASCGARTALLVDAREPDAAIEIVEDASVCQSGRFPLTQTKPELMFVLDRSASMDISMIANGEPMSRWMALESALTDALTPFSDEIAMGAHFFPSVRNDFGLLCGVEQPDKSIQPALHNVPKILDEFSRTGPFGSTPTADALKRAADELPSNRPRALVLATDGAPNCNTDLDPKTCICSVAESDQCNRISMLSINCLDDLRTAQTIATIADEKKIPVYVIGIDVAEQFTAALDAMAVAGRRARAGTPKYYLADTSATLTEAFASIRYGVAQCSYMTTSVPWSIDGMSLEVDGRAVARDTSHLDGWDWTDLGHGQVQLFGPACARATPTNVFGTVTCGY